MTAAMLPALAASRPPLTLDETTAALAASRATTFLRAQTQWLRRGLASSSDRIAVDVVLGAHDRSHERWMTIVHQVCEVLGEDAAAEVSGLYAAMGRVAGALEHRATEQLCPQVAREVRDLLGQRLADRTEGVVERLWQAAARA